MRTAAGPPLADSLQLGRAFFWIDWQRTSDPQLPLLPTLILLQPERPFLYAVEDPNDPSNDLGRNSYNISRVRSGCSS